MKKKYQFTVIAHFATILFALVAIIVKHLSMPIALIAWGRSLTAFMALAVYIYLSGASLQLKSTKHYIILLLLGIIQTAQWLTIFHAIQIANVSYALLSLYTFPLFITILEPIVFKEPLERKALFAALVVLAGVYLILPEMSFKNNYVLGIMWGVLSAILVAIMLLIHRKYVQYYSSTTITFYKTAVASIVLLPFIQLLALPTEGSKIGLIVILGVFCTALPFVLIIHSFKKIKAQKASLILSLEVLYGLTFAFIFYHEEPSIKTLLGGALLIGTTFIIKK